MKRTSIQPGGTSVPSRDRFPLAPVIGGVVVALVIALFFGLRSGHASQEVPVAAPTDDTVEDDSRPTQQVPGAIPPPQPAPIATRQQTPAPQGPTPQAALAELDKQLHAQRMFAGLSVDGTTAVVRSASCGDNDLGNVLSGSSASLAASGLTKLRCVEQSGRVVFERDL